MKTATGKKQKSTLNSEKGWNKKNNGEPCHNKAKRERATHSLARKDGGKTCAVMSVVISSSYSYECRRGAVFSYIRVCQIQFLAEIPKSAGFRVLL